MTRRRPAAVKLVPLEAAIRLKFGPRWTAGPEVDSNFHWTNRELSVRRVPADAKSAEFSATLHRKLEVERWMGASDTSQSSLTVILCSINGRWSCNFSAGYASVTSARLDCTCLGRGGWGGGKRRGNCFPAMELICRL